MSKPTAAESTLTAFINTLTTPKVDIAPYTDGKPGEYLVSHIGRDDAFIVRAKDADTIEVKRIRGS